MKNLFFPAILVFALSTIEAVEEAPRSISTEVFKDSEGDQPKEEKKKPLPPPVKIDPYTGKISKNKVRVRTQPQFDAPVLRELNANDLVVVVGEADDFYTVLPPNDVKAYVYRTFILDNVIEGNRVNARLKPDLDAPVIAQLNSGDRVEGIVYPSNTKWMEIKLPASARFYIAKEYITKAGDAGLKNRMEKKQDEANQLLKATDGAANAEMQKPFNEINLNTIKVNYEHLIKDFPEFPDVSSKAKTALTNLLDAYMAKKVAYLESQTQNSSNTQEMNKKLSSELQAQKSKVSQLEQQLQKNGQPVSYKATQLPVNMSAWIPAEDAFIDRWAQQTGNHSAKDFYDAQKKESFTVKGIIDTYTRPVKNKPGDYMLIGTASKLPIAFLYSTIVNLQDYVGHEVTLTVTPRPNNNFAFPAYFVLQLE